MSGTRRALVSVPFVCGMGDSSSLLSVLDAAHTSGGGVLGFLATLDARLLRAACAESRTAVSRFAWHDATTRIVDVAVWRASFPHARCANVRATWACGVTDAECARGNNDEGAFFARWSSGLTDARLAHVRGVLTLDVRGCVRVTGAGLVRHVAGVRDLDVAGCPLVTDAALTALAGQGLQRVRVSARLLPDGAAHAALRARGVDVEYVETAEDLMRRVHSGAASLRGVPVGERTPALSLAAVLHNGLTLWDVPAPLRTRALCLAAVRSDGRALASVPAALVDEELCARAVARTGDVIRFVPVALRSRAVYESALASDGWAIK